jgi:hypothetical protein
MAVISVLYLAAARNPTFGQRVLVSAHGATAALLYLGAMGISAAGLSKLWLSWPYLIAQLIPLGLIIVAFVRFKGLSIVHMLQPLNLVCMFYAAFVGGMAITGDWL